MSNRYFLKRYKPEKNRNRRKRDKTFKTIESAKAWANKNKIEKFEIKKMTYSTSESGKFMIVSV